MAIPGVGTLVFAEFRPWHTPARERRAWHSNSARPSSRRVERSSSPSSRPRWRRRSSSSGWERTYEGKDPPPPVDPPDTSTQFVLMANEEGALAIQVNEERVVRDLARIVSERVDVPLLVLMTSGSLFGRRSVEVVCRKYEFKNGESNELTVMAAHTRDVTDVEHNELRQADSALRTRIDGANESLLRAEGTAGFKAKKVLRYKRVVVPVKFSSPRLARLMEKIEECETFQVVKEGEQEVVKLVLPGGAKSMSYLKRDELAELEKGLQTRPELSRRRTPPRRAGVGARVSTPWRTARAARDGSPVLMHLPGSGAGLGPAAGRSGSWPWSPP